MTMFDKEFMGAHGRDQRGAKKSIFCAHLMYYDTNNEISLKHERPMSSLSLLEFEISVSNNMKVTSAKKGNEDLPDLNKETLASPLLSETDHRLRLISSSYNFPI